MVARTYAEGSASLPRARYLGLGFLRAWILACYADTTTRASGVGFVLNTDSEFAVSILVGVAALIACGLYCYRRPDAGLRPLLVPMLAACVLGLVLWSAPHGGPVSLVGAVLLGVSASVLFLLWADVLSRLDSGQVEVVVPGASLVMLACTVAVTAAPAVVADLLIVAFPLVSFMMLDLSYRDVERHAAAVADVPSVPVPPVRDFVPMFLKTALALFVLVMACYWARTAAAPDSGERALLDIMNVCGSFAGIALSLVFILFSNRIDLSSFSRWALPLCVVAVALLYWQSTVAAVIGRALAEAVVTAVRIATYLYFIRLVQRYVGLGMLGAAVAFSATQLGAFTGSHLAQVLAPGIAEGRLDMADPVLALICASVVAVMPLLGVRDGVQAPAAHDQRGGSPEEPGLEAHCRDFAARFGLTDREVDVLELLTAGRSQPYIREVLTLSKSTVSTHVMHIYRKCGVHSKQELLDLLETGTAGSDASR